MGKALKAAITVLALIAPPCTFAAPNDRAAWLEQVERGRRNYVAFVEKALVVRPPARRPGRFASPDRDPTLRDGDILVQETGLMIFRAHVEQGSADGRLIPLDPAGHKLAGELQAIVSAIHAR